MGFEVYYLANENEFTDDPFYEDVKIQEWLVNAPIFHLKEKVNILGKIVIAIII